VPRDQRPNDLPDSIVADAARLLAVSERHPAFHDTSPRRAADRELLGRTGADITADWDDDWEIDASPQLKGPPAIAPAVAGFGLFLLKDGQSRSAIVSYEHKLRGRVVAIDEATYVPDAIKAIRHKLESDPVVIGLAPPSPQAGCGSTLWADHEGSAGPIVKRASTIGLLTAGHVATTVGTLAYLDRREWGRVTFTTDGTGNSADVAFVERAAKTAFLPRAPKPTTFARPPLGEVVKGYGSKTCRPGNVMGIMPFQWFPALGRNLGDIMITAQSISEAGDSGALVVMADEENVMVGLIVGNDREARTYTSVQLAEYVLDAASSALA
jgi:hypothetical protein